MKIQATLLSLSVAVVSIGCETATNTNVNVNRANANTAIVVNANSNMANTRSVDWNANVNREEYDRNRNDYEKERGESTIGQGANDSWIWFKTRAALMTTDDLRESTINVDVENDVITLRGTVGSAAQKAAAEKVAKGIEGQKGVKNQLVVRAEDSMTNRMANGNSSNSNANRP
ncbi:hypothetical protein BH24ACI3_BH24ACI3_17440 [soil metagenome]